MEDVLLKGQEWGDGKCFCFCFGKDSGGVCGVGLESTHPRVCGRGKHRGVRFVMSEGRGFQMGGEQRRCC